jgi:hypothetical protein
MNQRDNSSEMELVLRQLLPLNLRRESLDRGFTLSEISCFTLEPKEWRTNFCVPSGFRTHNSDMQAADYGAAYGMEFSAECSRAQAKRTAFC